MTCTLDGQAGRHAKRQAAEAAVRQAGMRVDLLFLLIDTGKEIGRQHKQARRQRAHT